LSTQASFYLQQGAQANALFEHSEHLTASLISPTIASAIDNIIEIKIIKMTACHVAKTLRKSLNCTKFHQKQRMRLTG